MYKFSCHTILFVFYSFCACENEKDELLTFNMYLNYFNCTHNIHPAQRERTKANLFILLIKAYRWSIEEC